MYNMWVSDKPHFLGVSSIEDGRKRHRFADLIDVEPHTQRKKGPFLTVILFVGLRDTFCSFKFIIAAVLIPNEAHSEV